MAQLARAGSDVSRSAGTWLFSSGTSVAAMLNETLSNAGVTEVASPNTANTTHSATVALGLNHDGIALATPATRTDHVIVVHGRSYAGDGAVTLTVRLMEDTLGNGSYSTERAAFSPGVLNTAGYREYRYALSGAECAAIVDYSKLALKFEGAVGATPGYMALTYASFRCPDVLGDRNISPAVDDFTVLTEIPRWYEVHYIDNIVVPPPVLSGGSVRPPDGTYRLSILTNYRVDLPLDCYAETTAATGYDNTKMYSIAAFVRQKRDWVTHNTDSWRYDVVHQGSASRWENKRDGGASVVLSSVPYATVANIVAGDRSQTRAVDLGGGTTRVSGRKNGTEITTADDLFATLAVSGHAGFLVVPVNGSVGPWIGVSKFEMGSTTAPSVSAAGTLTLGALQVVGAGTAPAQASGILTLGALTLSGTATAPTQASGGLTLGALTLVGTGTAPVQASGVLTLGMLTVSGTGLAPVQASGVLALPALVVLGAAVVPVQGSGTLVVPALRVVGTGAVLGPVVYVPPTDVTVRVRSGPAVQVRVAAAPALTVRVRATPVAA